jgi:16S rRNA (guanine527-N7)-methyltransferase
MHAPIFPETLLDAAKAYLGLLDRWNAVHSITGLPPEARFEALLLDSAALLPHLGALPPGALVADFGSGMGAPAVALAAHRPDLRVAAIDRSRKKTAFVLQAVLELGLGNLEAVCGPIESIPPLGAQLGAAKAAGSLKTLLRWWERHSAEGAPFFAFRGPKWDQDVMGGGTRQPLDGHPPLWNRGATGGGWECEAFPYSLPTMGERAILKFFKAQRPPA